jgi:type III secretion system YscQ/HrcQ family protein
VQTRWKPYPWHAIEKVPKNAAWALREAFTILGEPKILEKVKDILPSMLGEPLEIVHSKVRYDNPNQPVFHDPVLCLLQNRPKSLTLLLEVEPELAFSITNKILHRPPLWPDRSQPTPTVLHAALGAFLLAAVQKSSPNHDLHFEALGSDARSRFAKTCGYAFRLDMTVLLDAANQGASIWWQASVPPSQEKADFNRTHLLAMGAIPLRIPLIAAFSLVGRAELSTLRIGDAWLPGEDWLVQHDPTSLFGEPWLMASDSCVGWCGLLHPDGKFVLGKGPMHSQESHDSEDVASDTKSDSESTLAHALADVPVIVRVEVGSVTLSARQWAALQPGDVIETGCAIAQQAVLRIGGIEVARGELVDVQGQLGIRINQIMTSNERGG